MAVPGAQSIDLFKIAGRSISGWVPSLKTGMVVRQPFCSQLEERLLLWLEYHPQVKSYARGDIGPAFASTYRLPIPQHAPFAIGYTFEDKPHYYLPDMVGTLTNGQPFIAEAGRHSTIFGERIIHLRGLEAESPVSSYLRYCERTQNSSRSSMIFLFSSSR